MSITARAELLRMAAARGFAARIVAMEHVDDAFAELDARRAAGMFDPMFAGERLSRFDRSVPMELPVPRSVLLFAVPSSIVRVTFRRHETVRVCLMPPTYVRYTSLPPEIASWASAVLARFGFHAAPVRSLPLKLMSVRSGLGRYGRNNLCFVPGMGSYGHLVGLYSDLPAGDDEWHEPAMLDRCGTCRACIRRCPVDAISLDRFLIRADRCITFHSERKADIPLPNWQPTARDGSIYGCMRCQRICPENRHVDLRVEEGAEFSACETELLLAGTALDDLPPDTASKLRRLELHEDTSQLRRNLLPLFANSRSPKDEPCRAL